MQPVRIGILGAGTVGSGTIKLLKENKAEMSRRLGRDLIITHIASRNISRIRHLAQEGITVSDQINDVIYSPDVDIVVELIGGTDVAREAVLQAIKNGKHIVTANKKLLAEYGNEVFTLAAQNNIMVMFEAAIAGGIPIVKALREGLAANQIQSVAGIINGTSNFILSEMRNHNSSFAEALKRAQELGYAEADPTFDIEGHDAAHKLSIISALVFGTPIHFNQCYLEGIRHLDSQDIKYAEELGYRVKLLGITQRNPKGIELRVHPTLIPQTRLIAKVDGIMNAISVTANMTGQTLYYGAGAGAAPTASAVVADIMDIARLLDSHVRNRVPYLAFQPDLLKNTPILNIDEITSSYYLRVTVQDQPGVLGKIANILAEEHISIEALIQKAVIDDEKIAEIVILTHSAREGAIKTAIMHMEAQSSILKKVIMIRMASL